VTGVDSAVFLEDLIHFWDHAGAVPEFPSWATQLQIGELPDVVNRLVALTSNLPKN